MNEEPLRPFQDLLLRRDLTPAEERTVADWLARHPEGAAEWHETVRLARAVRELPPAPVPSNFTARVLDEIRRDLARETRSDTARRPAAGWRNWARLRLWIPTAAAVVVAVFASWDCYQRTRLAEFARDVTPLRVIASVPQEVLQDFEAIQRFGQTAAPVDFELLAALE